ncbi:DUF2783 domain-containing protein [Sphingobium sp. AN641]|uniref:DUF2783 domain-containing protein n=1 Tax=Sphingobium sp. AN641 TaxID=3133443 RepID=UPI0030BF80E4
MTRLMTNPNIARPDDIYERLIDLHADRSPEESLRINARLILLLINHVGDPEVLQEAFAIAAATNQGANR